MTMTMGNDGMCSYGSGREEAIVSYLYDDITPEEKVQFNRHLSGCVVCRTEIESLSAVRAELGSWGAPEQDGRIVTAPAAFESGPRLATRPVWQRLNTVPVWAQSVAAVLVLGVAAGFANLDISYSPSAGLSVRTGWMRSAPADVPPSSAVASVAPAPASVPAPEAAKADIKDDPPVAVPVSAPITASSDEALLRKVRAIVLDSEKRQQRELALRLAEYTRESQTQRQADLVRIDRSLGLLQRSTGMEVMRTQQQLNSLVQRVSEPR